MSIVQDMVHRIALVTGSGRGIGREIALELANRGADVVVNYFRNRKPAEAIAAEITALGRKALVIKANIGELSHIESMFAEIESSFGALDILINNAASGFNKPLLEQTEKGWDWTLNINARAMLFCMQKAFPLMQKRGGGHIVSLSSLGANRVLPEYALVGASKSVVETLTRYMAVELGPHNIVVNAVSAGYVLTDAVKHFAVLKDPDLLPSLVRATPAGRLVTPQDVAKLVAFLCSDSAFMIRGQVLTIDGGFNIQMRS